MDYLYKDVENVLHSHSLVILFFVPNIGLKLKSSESQVHVIFNYILHILYPCLAHISLFPYISMHKLKLELNKTCLPKICSH